MIKLTFLNLCLIPILLLTSCQKRVNKKTSTLRVNLSSDPTTLDPRKGSDLSSATLHFLLYEGLVRQEPNNKRDLGLAESVSVSDDGLTYKFTLKKAYWSNGNLITSYDVIQTFKDMLSATFPCPNAHLLYCIKNAKKAKQGLISQRQIGIRGLNYKTLEITLESVTPYFLDILSFSSLSPVNQNIAQARPLYNHTRKNPLVSNGPYRLTKYIQGQEIILEKNPFYWDKENVFLEKIVISIINCSQTILNLFEKGEIDYMGVPFTQIPQEILGHKSYKDSIKCGALPASTLLSFNLDSKIFKNENIRKAFSLSIDRKEIYYSILNQNVNVKSISFFSHVLDNNPKPYFDVHPQAQVARDCLKKGLKELQMSNNDLKHLTLMHSSFGDYAQLAQILQEQWSKNLGIMIQLDTAEHGVFLGKLYVKDYDFSLCCWIAQYLSKMNFFERFIQEDHIKNYPGINDILYKELINQITQTQNPDEINLLYNQLEALLVSSRAIVPIYHWSNQYMLSDKIQSFELLPSGSVCYKRIKMNNKHSV